VGEALAGRRGVVLGLSSENGMGFRCAAALAARGAEVAGTCRPARLPAVEALAARAGLAALVPADASDPASFERAFADLDRRWGRLDFLVHAIVAVPPGVLAAPLCDVSREVFDAVLGTTVHSLVTALRFAAPLLDRSDAARVVALTSEARRRMTPNHHVVGIAKAALGAAVLYLAQELGPRGILVNAVSFSLVATDGAVRAIGAEAAAQTRAHLARRAPTRAPIEPEDVAAAVAFLAGPACRNVTGEVLAVDGGFSHLYFA
jgi:enoyl-[acyl-carrier protein] reductase I